MIISAGWRNNIGKFVYSPCFVWHVNGTSQTGIGQNIGLYPWAYSGLGYSILPVHSVCIIGRDIVWSGVYRNLVLYCLWFFFYYFSKVILDAKSYSDQRRAACVLLLRNNSEKCDMRVVSMTSHAPWPIDLGPRG